MHNEDYFIPQLLEKYTLMPEFRAFRPDCFGVQNWQRVILQISYYQSNVTFNMDFSVINKSLIINGNLRNIIVLRKGKRGTRDQTFTTFKLGCRSRNPL
jgi:hypothetical protein